MHAKRHRRPNQHSFAPVNARAKASASVRLRPAQSWASYILICVPPSGVRHGSGEICPSERASERASSQTALSRVASALQMCPKSRRIGRTIPRCNLQRGITQPILRLFDISAHIHKQCTPTHAVFALSRIVCARRCYCPRRARTSTSSAFLRRATKAKHGWPDWPSALRDLPS